MSLRGLFELSYHTKCRGIKMNIAKALQFLCFSNGYLVLCKTQLPSQRFHIHPSLPACNVL